MSFAPVLIPTLNRFEHFKKCVESLLRNKHAEKTHLFVALDAPFKESHYEGYNKISNYLNEITGFKELTIFKRDTNLGAEKNSAIAQEDIFKIYDRVIFSEDDNFFSENFLEFINKGLDKYQSDSRVFAICGYGYPVQIPQNYGSNFYMWKGFSAWGFGIWRDRFSDEILSLETIENYLKSPKNAFEVEKYASHYLPALLLTIKTKHVTGDTAMCMHLIKNNMYCIFPTLSKVRNYGHDGSGIHCGLSDIYKSQPIDDKSTFLYSNGYFDRNNKEIYRVLKDHFNIGWIARCKTYIKYILFYLGIKF